MSKSGTVGKAHYEIISEADATTKVRLSRDYSAGVSPTTSQRVWEIAADFGGIKTIFPSVLRVNLTFPDATTTAVNTVRAMTFAPPDPTSPLSQTNSLSFGVEQLVDLNTQQRRLTYISVLGLPVRDYRSVMEVKGEDACTLNWTSTFASNPGQDGFADILATILAAGANQIAKALSLE
jgi:hypothetical protein